MDGACLFSYCELPDCEDPVPLPDALPGVDGLDADPEVPFGAEEDEPLPLIDPPGAGAVAEPFPVPELELEPE